MEGQFHLFDSKDRHLIATDDCLEAMARLRGLSPGARIVRNDGATLAYTSAEGGSRSKKGFPRHFRKSLDVK